MYSLGSDPELFLKDKASGQFLPVCGRLGGTKEKPIAMEGMPDGYAVQEDNVMLEFNIPACHSSGAFTSAIENAMAYIWKDSGEKLNAEPLPTCCALFPYALLGDNGAQIFGCSPDFDGYAFGERHAPIDRRGLREAEGEWRFAGGHIHIGYGRKDLPPFVAAQFGDIYLGLPSVPFDKQNKRRELYGKAGRYRPTKYGFEYRTLSNFWLFDHGLLQTIAQASSNLGNFLDSAPMKYLKKIHGQIPWNEVQSAIQTENVELAGDMLAYAQQTLRIGDF